MRITKVKAVNFRALKRVAISNTHDVNVIAGPNAAGKSTLLEVIRLAKTILAPRFNGEAQQALIQLGALSPHNQAIGSPGLDLASLANEPDKVVTLRFCTELNQQDATYVKASMAPLSMLQLQTELSSNNEGALAFTQYLSTEIGKARFSAIQIDTARQLEGISAGCSIDVELTMDPVKRELRGGNSFHQSVLTLLDRRLPNNKALFRFFPADRTFPQGEQPIQVGSGDAQQQLLSHMATPSLNIPG